MRKTIILLLTLISITACAEDVYYSNYISQKQRIDSVWTDWTDWKESYTSITISSNNIIVDDDVYTITSTGKHKDDCSETMVYLVKDSNNKHVTIRLRCQKNGIRQLYVDCENLVTVYNLM